MTKKLKIVPLGGLGEVGKNMMAYEYGENVLIVDIGIMFPENDMLGVDYIIPDFADYIAAKRDSVRGIVITHGHEDHIGAISHLLQQVSAPVYGTTLTMGLAEVKMKRNKMSGQGDFNIVQAGDFVNIGPFKVEFFHVCHSIPDSVGLGITSPAGLVLHVSDYKFDHTPVDGWPTDYAKIAEFSQRGVDLLLADSTNATRPGWTPSEMVIGPALDTVFENAPARIIVASFASQISRMQQVADAAVKHGRKIAFVGMSMVDNSKLAIKMGYLEIPTNTLVSLDQALGMKGKDVVLMGTGSQGEPSSIMGRLATGTNRHFGLKNDDTIVLSSHPIPGNEESVSKTINSLLRRGATVIDDTLLPIHVSGHASQEEMKLLLNLVRPKNFIPMHGDLNMLKRHALMAEEMGIPAENITVAENGQVIELVDGKLIIGERIPGGYIFVDGHSIGGVDHKVMRERERLAQGGIFLIDLNIDKFTGKLMHDPEIITRGYVTPEEAEDLIPIVQKKVIDMIDGGLDNRKTIMNAIRSFLYNETKRKTMVFVTLSKV
ncbi:MAG: ribonuclease J [Anaerolineae bacterium]|jgi:ribonuclease J|nr:ribonuclease J [Anaerolineae bacterium]MBT7075762.1 ribonuclease J [Anaerolineae bacterium]MBT7783925.1 ribonuclease J [Anaerolineae bacterium]